MPVIVTLVMGWYVIGSVVFWPWPTVATAGAVALVILYLATEDYW